MVIGSQFNIFTPCNCFVVFLLSNQLFYGLNKFFVAINITNFDFSS